MTVRDSPLYGKLLCGNNTLFSPPYFVSGQVTRAFVEFSLLIYLCNKSYSKNKVTKQQNLDKLMLTEFYSR